MSVSSHTIYLRLSRGKLAEVSVVVTAHFHVEDLGLGDLSLLDQLVLKEVKHLLADEVELTLDLLAVPLDQLEVLAALVLFSVLDG